VSHDDLDKFFAVIEDMRDRAMFTLMLRCGLRIGEVASLKLTDLYLDEARPRLVAHGKGSKERSVYLSAQAERALRAYLHERPLMTCDFVFLSYLGAGLSTTAIHKRLMIYRAQADIKITAHRLRHTFGRSFGRLVNASMDAAREQTRVFSLWRFRMPRHSGLVSFQRT
jgi:site-specific recombinase XerD